jgi:predicted MFS family arabinose efflux permease
MLFAMRLLGGVGEGGYGRQRRRYFHFFPSSHAAGFLIFTSRFLLEALGFAIGGFVTSHWGWQTAFLRWPAGCLLGIACFVRRDPRDQSRAVKTGRATLRDYIRLAQIKSYVWNTLAMTALTFAQGGLAFWIPRYLQHRGLPPNSRIVFGGMLVAAGITATPLEVSSGICSADGLVALIFSFQRLG